MHIYARIIMGHTTPHSSPAGLQQLKGSNDPELPIVILCHDHEEFALSSL
jgi:hypothetical protein